MVIELRVMQFWSEIKLVITNAVNLSGVIRGRNLPCFCRHFFALSTSSSNIHSLLQIADKVNTIFEPTQNVDHLSIRQDRRR